MFWQHALVSRQTYLLYFLVNIIHVEIVTKLLRVMSVDCSIQEHLLEHSSLPLFYPCPQSISPKLFHCLCLVLVKSCGYLHAYIMDSFELICFYVTYTGGYKGSYNVAFIPKRVIISFLFLSNQNYPEASKYGTGDCKGFLSLRLWVCFCQVKAIQHKGLLMMFPVYGCVQCVCICL